MEHKPVVIQINDKVFAPAGATRVLRPAKIREARLAMQLTQTELAARAGVTRQSISAYEQGLTIPEPPVLASIATAVAQPLLYFFEDPAPEFGPSSTRFFRAFGPDTKRRNLACEILGSWLARTAKYLDQFVNYPDVDVPPAPPPVSENGSYDSDEIEAAAARCRQAWGLGLGPISDMVALLENKGVLVCRVTIPNERIEAFSFWNGDKALVFLASEKKSAYRARFDAAHELGHLILHRGIGQEEIDGDKATLKRIEREADLFAGAFLLPKESFLGEVFSTRLDAFLPLKRRWKVSVGAMVYRCKELGVVDDDQATNLFKTISFRKWRTKEPYDETTPFEEPRLLARAASVLLASGHQNATDVSVAIQINRKTIERICNLDEGALDSTVTVREFRPTLKSPDSL
jgi:Zn-dependent peptidase ImmA (M78 family)/transcriptional regulator with XRE-family HTH domain